MSQERYTELFLEEATEYVEELNQNLIILEREGHQDEVINNIFRSAHTLKSSAAFVGLDRLSAVSHSMEDLLQKIKDGDMEATTHIINILFHCLDRIKRAIQNFAEGEKADDDFADLIEEIKEVQSPAGATARSSTPAAQASGSSGGGVATMAPPSVTSEESSDSASDNLELGALLKGLTAQERSELVKVSAGNKIYTGLIRLDEETPMKNIRYLLLFENINKIGTVFKSSPSADDLEKDGGDGIFRFIAYGDMSRELLFQTCQIDMVEDLMLNEIKTATAKAAKKIAASQSQGDKAVAASGGRKLEAKTETQLHTKNIKVSADKIDFLMNNVGESVITNSGLMKIYDDLTDNLGDHPILDELKGKIESASRIARDLQSGIMKMRMIPISLVFHRFTRPIRDICQDLGKEVDIAFQGEDTELDKNIVDALTDPLLHLIRNALDHGIETTEERRKLGKPENGSLLLNSYQGGNNIYIEIKDDGRGLDKDKILLKANTNGLIEKGVTLTDDEIYDLIFHPGFSTADAVTDLSGRGVGMNVVKTMVGKFNGSVRIQTELGQGTSFILSFPLTLAIISAILVKVEDEEYAFPLSDVVENIKINHQDITTLEGRDIFNLRGEILPIFFLNKLMGYPRKLEGEDFPVVIISNNNRKIGFVVSNLVGKSEIVIKSLDQNFQTVPGLIGACLMGDGRIVSVIDTQGLLDMAYNRNREVTHETQLSSGEALKAVSEYNAAVQELNRQAQSENSTQRKRLAFKADEPEEEEITSHSAPKEIIAAAPLNGGVTTEPGAQPATGQPPSDDEADKKVAEAIKSLDLDREYKQNLALEASLPEHEEVTTELSEAEYSRLYETINTGMMNSGLVLSQLLGVTVEVSVPELKLVKPNDLAEYLPQQKIISVWLDTEGDFDSILLLTFDESTGYKAAGDLMGLPEDSWNEEGIAIEDLQSVLSELTNIVGANLLNALAKTAGKKIMPSVPSFIMGGIEKLKEKLNTINDSDEKYRVIYISADFFREDMELLGRLFLFLPHHSLNDLIRE